jgi:HAD superfamily hydrolase (TIGR01509 family)
LENSKGTEPALVFDFDGVLADTEILHWKSWAALLVDYGMQLSWEEYCDLGRGVDDAQFCETIKAKVSSVNVADLLSQNLARKRMVREWSLSESPIPPETIKLLRTLGVAYQIGLVTSSGRPEVEPILRASAIHELFDAMVFGEDVTALKPAPDPYLLIAQRLGVSTGIVFEDSQPGIESAHSAGFKVVRVEQPKDLAETVARSLNVERLSRLNLPDQRD